MRMDERASRHSAVQAPPRLGQEQTAIWDVAVESWSGGRAIRVVILLLTSVATVVSVVASPQLDRAHSICAVGVVVAVQFDFVAAVQITVEPRERNGAGLCDNLLARESS